MAGFKVLNSNQKFHKKKIRDARSIRVEASKISDKFSNELSESATMLKVPEFISSREFEIRQLQMAIHKSKNSSSTRVFQSLPRKLRRRTASHNVKRIPKRMRNRALREMKKSSQLVTNGTKGPLKRTHGISNKKLYKLKMSVKLLRLAAKSTSMKLALPYDATPSNFKLKSCIKTLKNQIREYKKTGHAKRMLNNQLGSYDNTGVNSLASKPIGRIKYMKRQHSFTWLSTHVWNAKRCHMVKMWNYQVPWSPTQKCFRLTHRIMSSSASSDGSMCCDTSFIGTLLILCKDYNSLKNLVSQLTNNRGQLKKYSESQNLFEGLIYHIETHAILGPCTLIWVNFETVMIRLHPSIYTQTFDMIMKFVDINKFTLHDCRYAIGSITLAGAKSLYALSQVIRVVKETVSYKQFKSVSKVTDQSILPQRAIFAFHAIDPRYLSKPKPICVNKPDSNFICELQTLYPQKEISDVLSNLCDPIEREKSYRNQHTLKQLTTRRHKTSLKSVSTNMIPFDENIDPKIPLTIIKHHKDGNWIVLLPWYWLLPFWYQLNKISRVYHVGIRQLHQHQFERGRLYFPSDFPFTNIGYKDLRYKRKILEESWRRKPLSKKVNYGKIQNLHKASFPTQTGEIGDWFSSDWRWLQILQNGITYLGPNPPLIDPARTTHFDQNGMREIKYLHDLLELYHDVKDHDLNHSPVEIYNKDIKTFVIKPLNDSNPIQSTLAIQPISVIAISCKLVERGSPKDNARIYSIPKEDLKYWMSISQGIYRSNGKRDHDQEAPLPRIDNLIGYLTSGAYHLGLGKGLGNGFISASYASSAQHHYFLIRNLGTNIYRLAHWYQVII